MKNALLSIMFLSAISLMSCKSDEQAHQEEQQQTERVDSLNQSVLDEANEMLSNDSAAAPVTEDSAAINAENRK